MYVVVVRQQLGIEQQRVWLLVAFAFVVVVLGPRRLSVARRPSLFLLLMDLFRVYEASSKTAYTLIHHAATSRPRQAAAGGGAVGGGGGGGGCGGGGAEEVRKSPFIPGPPIGPRYADVALKFTITRLQAEAEADEAAAAAPAAERSLPLLLDTQVAADA